MIRYEEDNKAYVASFLDSSTLEVYEDLRVEFLSDLNDIVNKMLYDLENK